MKYLLLIYIYAVYLTSSKQASKFSAIRQRLGKGFVLHFEILSDIFVATVVVFYVFEMHLNQMLISAMMLFVLIWKIAFIFAIADATEEEKYYAQTELMLANQDVPLFFHIFGTRKGLPIVRAIGIIISQGVHVPYYYMSMSMLG